MISVILPPPDLRHFIDKTAAYVAKNGPEFEERIQQKERGNTKFAFLTLHDPFHPYYRRRVDELMEGGPAAIEAAIEESSRATRVHVTEGSAVTKALSSPPPPPAEPAPLLFHLGSLMPIMSPLDLDILKLTALHYARHGKCWLAALLAREQRNPQFDFLRPTHPLHRLWGAFCEQYRRVLQPDQAMLERLRLGATAAERLCGDSFLEAVRRRSAYEAYLAKKMRERASAEEREQLAMLAIDWQDFCIVETIDFGPAEISKGSFPPPWSRKAVERMSVSQRQELWAGSRIISGVETAAAAADEMEIEDDNIHTSVINPQGLPVRLDYVPRSSNSQTTSLLQQCGICQQMIPAGQIQEHMRVEMLDPKWATQRQAYLAKHTETNLVAPHEMAANLLTSRKRPNEQ